MWVIRKTRRRNQSNGCPKMKAPKTGMERHEVVRNSRSQQTVGCGLLLIGTHWLIAMYLRSLWVAEMAEPPSHRVHRPRPGRFTCSRR